MITAWPVLRLAQTTPKTPLPTSVVRVTLEAPARVLPYASMAVMVTVKYAPTVPTAGLLMAYFASTAGVICSTWVWARRDWWVPSLARILMSSARV